MKGPAIFLAQFAGAAPPFAGLVEAGFAELARRWRPILDAFDEAGVDVCFEIHPERICTTARRSSGSSKHPADGAPEGAPFIRSHMIRASSKSFDDFAASSADPKAHARILGLDQQ